LRLELFTGFNTIGQRRVADENVLSFFDFFVSLSTFLVLDARAFYYKI
jgi:hypothetical protein